MFYLHYTFTPVHLADTSIQEM